MTYLYWWRQCLRRLAAQSAILQSRREPFLQSQKSAIRRIEALTEEASDRSRSRSRDSTFDGGVVEQDAASEPPPSRPVPAEIDGRDGGVERAHDLQLVRDIAHALGTPLAQMAAEISLLRERNSKGDLLVDSELEIVQSGVEVCGAFLEAFLSSLHQLGGLDASEPEALGSLLSRWSRLYSERGGPQRQIIVEVPDRLAGYPNRFILACLLPLLENAVEADNVPSSTIRVSIESVDDLFAFVVNHPRQLPDLSLMEARGHSGKAGHLGLGLPLVKRLASRAGGDLRCTVGDDGALVCGVILPRRG